MTDDRPLFDLLRRLKRRWSGKSVGLTQGEVDEVKSALDGTRTPAAVASATIGTKRGPLTAIVGTIAATSLFASVPSEEGTKLKAYRDIVGVWTVCNGDTNDVHPGLIETPEGCRVRLERQLVAHAGPVMACTPRLSEPGRDYQRAAAVSLAYNIGVAAYCRSTVDHRFDAGDIRGACDAFLMWNRAGGKVVRGLQLRRERERDTCLKGL